MTPTFIVPRRNDYGGKFVTCRKYSASYKLAATIRHNSLFILLSLGSLAAAVAGVAVSADGGSAPAFVVATADGKTLTGPLRELKADWSLRTGDSDLASGDWLSVRRDGHKLPPLPAGPHLILVNGDRIPFEATRLDGETLYFKHADLADGKQSRVPLTALSVVWLAAPDNTDYPDRLRRNLAKASRARDQVLLRNGDVLEGVLTALTEKKIGVEVDKKPVEVATDSVAAVALGTEVVNALKPKGVYGRVVLLGDGRANGTRLSLSSATCTDGRTLDGKTLFGSTLRVPLDRVASLDVYQGRAVYLSDLKPAEFEFTPYFGDGGLAWPLVADGNVDNGDLRLGGSTYDKGIGLHTRSRVTYNLAGAYRRFEAVVGLDDDAREGSARVRILGDGKLLDPRGDRELTARTGPLAVNLSVADVKELILEVDFLNSGNVQGRVNWCDARLIK
jgi:NPCBM/NEW2 domain